MITFLITMLSAKQIKDTLWKQDNSIGVYYKMSLQLCMQQREQYVTLDKSFAKVRIAKQNFNSQMSISQVHFRGPILDTGRVKEDKI